MPEKLQSTKRFKPNAIASSSNLPILGRTRLMAGLQQQAARQQAALGTPPSKYPKLKAFLSSYIWPWIWNYLKNTFRRKLKPYPYYNQPSIDNGMYPLSSRSPGNPIKLALAGDWGTGTYESFEIANAITAWEPDYTIHLGDVYYVGDQPEINENFLGKPGGNDYTPVTWPIGKIGEFAMVGNHEMYAGGVPYFTSILHSIQTATGTLRTGTGQYQKASFFALETEHWRIIALDTGYNSVGWPILGSIPWIKKLPFIGANCKMQAEFIDWLRNTIKPQQNRKPTLLLSHHQYYSAFNEEISGVPADQLVEFFADQEVVWIWAHEHRLAIYDSFAKNGKLKAYGRCLGNGGMPVECATPDIKKAPLAFYDPRCDYPLDDQTCAGNNGFLRITLDGSTMKLDYLDIKGNFLFAESFVGAADGSLIYSVLPSAGPIFLQRPKLPKATDTKS